jgi:hypothetical protein
MDNKQERLSAFRMKIGITHAVDARWLMAFFCYHFLPSKWHSYSAGDTATMSGDMQLQYLH